MKNCNNPLYLTAYKALLFIGLLLIQSSLFAAPSTLQPFSAYYDVYRNNQHVANAHFVLNKQNDTWVWNMQTRPIGFYSWLTRKKPFSETRMSETANGLQLTQELKGDYRNKPAKEKTWFDQKNSTIYYSKGEKKKQQTIPKNLYNFQSVHLIPGIMKQQELDQFEVDFYKKGKLFKSTFKLEPAVKLKQKDKDGLVVDKLTQRLDPSDYEMIYYYHGNTLAPLKIEQLKANGDNSVMWRSSVE